MNPDRLVITEAALNHPDDDALRALSSGELTEGELAHVAAHLGDCPACCGRIDQLASDDRLLARLQQTAASRAEVLVTPAQRRSAVRALRQSREPRSDTGTKDPEAAPVILPAPRHVGDYDILAEVGRGGMGVVYKARHRGLHRLAALKMVLAGEFASPAQEPRFRLEAELAARVQHPNIVQVYEIGNYAGRPFLALEWVEGGSLANRLDGKPWPPVEAAALIETLARAIDAAHSEDVIHRDLKPANILLQERDDRRLKVEGPSGRPGAIPDPSSLIPDPSTLNPQPSTLIPDPSSVIPHPSSLIVPKITDFGLAQTIEGGQTLTQSGYLVGTPGYMAPEQASGKRALVGPATDIHALGVMLYQLLTGQLPFRHDSTLELLRAVTFDEPTRPRRLQPRVPRDLEAITLQCLEKEPGGRYQSALALAEDLRRFLADEPIRARRASAVERNWRWARRNPAIAVLGGILIAVLVLATTFSLWLAGTRETARKGAELARSQEAAARHKTDQANVALRARDEQLRRNVYAARTSLALAAWDNNEVGRLRSLLDLLRPDPGEPDLRGWEWRYLWQLDREDRLTLRAGESRFSDAMFNPDGQTSSSRSNSSLSYGFSEVAFSPDGQTLAGLERNGRVHFWDRRTGQSRRTTEVTTRDERSDLSPTSGAHALAFNRDGRRLAGPGPDASLVLYAVETARPILRFEGPSEAILSLAWSPDGRTLVAALSRHVMRVWDSSDGHLIHMHFGTHKGPVASVAFSPDGRTIASASYDRTVKLWGLEEPRRPRAVLEGHTEEVRAVAFSPDGRWIGSASMDRTLRVWDARSGAQVAVIRGHTSSVTSLAYLPGGEQVVTGSADETVRVWDTATGQELRCFKGHADTVAQVAVSPDGRDIASASRDRTVRVWDAASQPSPRTLRSPSVLTYGGAAECLAFSPDGRRLISGHDDQAVRVWDLLSDRPPQVLKGHTESVRSVAFSPDGRTIASGGDDSTVRVWDAASGELRLTFTGHSDVIRGLVFTPDGRTVLSSGRDRTIQAWDPATGAVRYVLRGHSDWVHDLALSPDGRTLASASYDKTCILWNLAARQPRVTLRGHTDRLNTVVFSPDGRIVATASDDNTVRLWDAAAGSPGGVLVGHIDRVEGLAFCPDGRLASSAGDRTIRLWDPASGQTLLILKGHAGQIRCIKFSPDGRTLASAGYDRTVKLWEAAPAAAGYEAAPDSNTEAASASIP